MTDRADPPAPAATTPGAPFALRSARADDAAALGVLGAAAFVAKFGLLYRPADLSAYLAEAYTPAAVARELADPSRVFCVAVPARAESPLRGWCKLGLACGFPQHARGRRVMELKQLYTAADATGQGIGAALMDWAMAEFAARGADEVQISVWSGNHGAQRFYARYGFAKVADVTFRVGEQLDEEFLFARML
ncbi:MAG: GNAT family N-acetyltransferase [Pseudomonadota bacterium]